MSAWSGEGCLPGPGGCLPGLGGVCLVRGVSAWSGGVSAWSGGSAWSRGGSPCPGGGGFSLPGDPPVNRITYTCKNITLATTSLRPLIFTIYIHRNIASTLK